MTFYQIFYIRDLDGKEDSATIYYEHESDARSYFNNVTKNPIIKLMEIWEYVSNDNGIFDGNLLREYSKEDGLKIYEDEIETFSTGGGCASAQLEYNGLIYNIASEGIDCLNCYDMKGKEDNYQYYDENMVFSKNINEESLSEEEIEIYNKLKAAFDRDFPYAVRIELCKE